MRPELVAPARGARVAALLKREGAAALARHAGHEVLLQLGPLITVVARENPDHLVRRRADLRGRAGVGLADHRTGVGRRISVPLARRTTLVTVASGLASSNTRIFPRPRHYVFY